MSTEIEEILAELKELRKEIDRLKSFDVPRASGDFVRITGDDNKTGSLNVSGNVGIGTTAPDGIFHVIGANSRFQGAAGGDMLRLSPSGANSGALIDVANDAENAYKEMRLYASNLKLYAGGSVGIDIIAGGNVGIGTTGPTAKFSVAEKCAMNADGGFMVKLTNKTGAASVKGEVVTPDTTVNNGVKKIIVDVPNPVGVFYESGVADGAEAWVVVAGIADVYFVGNTTRGHLARGFLTADGASYVAGQALSEAVPTAPFANDRHFYEIGHLLESRVGAGIAKTILHFN